MAQRRKEMLWADECQPLTNEQMTDIKSQFHPSNTANVTFALPTGSIITTMGKIAPDGYLVCDGTVYNIEDYQDLANYFTEQFESVNYFGGDGETTFAVPDLRGEFLRGSGTNSHTNQGSGGEVGIHQDGTEHTAGWFNNTEGGWDFTEGTSTTSYLNLYKKADKRISSSRASSAYTSSLKRQANTSGSGVWFTSRPTNTSVLYSIKY